jgi:hypothetical protein
MDVHGYSILVVGIGVTSRREIAFNICSNSETEMHILDSEYCLIDCMCLISANYVHRKKTS